MADGMRVEGMEAFAPLPADRMELLFDSLPPGALVVACDPERIRTRASDLVRTSQEFVEASWVNAAVGGQVPIDLGGAAFRPITEVRAAAASLGFKWWTITPFSTEEGHNPDAESNHVATSPADEAGAESGWDTRTDGRESFRMMVSPATAYHGEVSRAVADVRGWLSDGWRVALVTEGHGPAQRLAQLLRSADLGARTGDLDAPPERRVAVVATGELDAGFVWPEIKLAVLCEADLAGQRTGQRDRSRMPSRRRGGIDPLRLTPGDYVVDSQHGVGRYLEMTSRTIQGATREYLVIEYAPSKRGQPPDRLYLPTDQLDQPTTYSRLPPPIRPPLATPNSPH